MSIWFDFLATQNALDLKYPDVSSTGEAPLLIPMLQHRLLQVTGPDAVKFLQGQVTCDLRRLTQHDHLLGGHCNAKGRMISSFTLASLGEETVGMRLRSNLIEVALSALRKYLVFSKARIEAAPLVPLAVMGNLAQLSYKNLPAPGKSLSLGDTVLLRHSEDLLEIWTPEAAAVTLWQQLAPICTSAGAYHLDRFWVDRGVVEVQAGISEEFVPQMLNYHLVDGISFKKGCYTGQEIIARMQYKGQAKKHTYAMHCNQPVDLEPGDTLTGADSEKILATVAACAPGTQDWRGLVVATDESRENEAFLMAKKTGAKLTWMPLPYAIPKQ